MDHNNWLGMRVALPFHVPGGYEAKVWRLEACFFSGPKFEYPFYYYIPLPEDREETLQILADIAHNRGYAPGEIAKEIHDRRERDAAGR